MNPSTPLEIARFYFGRGWMPIPIPYQSKNPNLKGWSRLKITDGTLPDYFDGRPQNIGILLGSASGGLCDIDLDCPETVALAPSFLPQTGAIFGRESSQCSHWLYYSDISTRKYSDPLLERHKDESERKRAMLVEIRSTGAQTVFPGSVHPLGEAIRWDSESDPTSVTAEKLTRAVSILAAAVLLARYWPRGRRNDAANALAGGLLRAGWSVNDAMLFIEAICRIAQDEETRARVRAIVDTKEKLATGGPVTGWPTLSEIFDSRIVDRVCEWLDIRERRISPQALQAPATLNAEWPVLDPSALYGLAGEFVRLVEPHTEADPVALLVQFLVAFGNIIGRTAHAIAEADKHFMNLFAVVVGATAGGRKGSSWGHVRRLFAALDSVWAQNCLLSGLSSGEGLIYAVRDPVTQTKPIKAGGQETGVNKVVVVDEGITDKRALVFEGEFASVLRVQGREGNTLSAVIRNLWDSGNARSLVKNNPNRTTGAHISTIGHITKNELTRCLDETEAFNGYANRFLWFLVRRSKYLAEGGSLQDEDFAPLLRRLRQAIDSSSTLSEIKRDDEARELWRRVYPRLVDGRLGLYGAVTARADAQVMRLSCLYALLDSATIVRREHLEAALALWKYAEDSARYIFGGRTGDRVADEILRALRDAGEEGMTQTALNDLFHGHRSSGAITNALNTLAEARLVCSKEERTGGRPVRRWFATSNTAEKAEKEDEVLSGISHGEAYSAFSAYSAPTEYKEPLNEDEEELAGRLQFMEGLSKEESERRARAWFAPVPF